MSEEVEEPTLDDRIADALTRSAPFLPLGVAAAAVGLGVLRGPGAGVLTLAGGAMLGAISALWSSIRVLSGDAPVSLSEAIDLGSPSALDERKQSILRALKDVQHEHKLGKITDEDFQRISQQYRAEARDLLREIDETLAPARQEAEALVARKLAGEPVNPKKKKAKKAPEPAPEDSAEDGQSEDSAADSESAEGEKPAGKKTASKKPAGKAEKPAGKTEKPAEAPADKGEEPADKGEKIVEKMADKPADKAAEKTADKAADGEEKILLCPACETRNDTDAAFCKKCGGKLAA